MKRFIKPIIFCLLTMIILSFFTSCAYNPPVGYTEKHHNRDEILEFARSIDPNATVSEAYTDTQIDDWNRNFREWDSVINGIECHVSSVGAMVWNDGFIAGEFAKQYYVIDTDYDYLLLQKIISESYPDWEMSYKGIDSRYNWNGLISVQHLSSAENKLSFDELEDIWSNAFEIYTEYNSNPVRKAAWFCIPALNGEVIFYDFSAEGKNKFFEDYENSFDVR